MDPDVASGVEDLGTDPSKTTEELDEVARAACEDGGYEWVDGTCDDEESYARLLGLIFGILGAIAIGIVVYCCFFKKKDDNDFMKV